MRISATVGAALALLAAVPSVTSAAMGNPAPVVDGTTVNPLPAPANASAVVSCAAHDDTGVALLRVRVSGGGLPGGTTLPDGSVYADLPISQGLSVSGSISWSTPGPGTYTVTCIASDIGGGFGGPVSAALPSSVEVVQSEAPPVILSFGVPSGPFLPGARVALAAAAADPSGGAVTYAWTASGGAIVAAGETATWTAPDAGTYAITLTVTGATGRAAVATQSIAVAHATYAGGLGGSIEMPTRIAVTASGDLWVVDARGGRLFAFTPRGDLKFAAPLREQIVAVAAAPSAIYASTVKGQLLEIEPTTGAARRALPLLVPGAVGLAWEPVRGRLWVAQKSADRVLVVQPDGAVAAQIAAVGASRLLMPTDVAVDAANGIVWVAQARNEGGGLVHAFTADGAFVRSIVPFGSGLGSVTRAGGIAVGDGGRVYVSDVFQGTVQVVSPDGTPVATVGEFGTAAGQLRNPGDVALLANGDVIVANSDAGRLERFARGAPLPTCAGDTDCDGLPDVWELAHGLNPNWAGDAALDLDGDGLSNLVELALGTDPRRRDSDGDGYADGEEVLAGFSPTDPNDHRAVVVGGQSRESGPGLVQLALALSAPAGSECFTGWRQLGGPAGVALSDARSATPSFIARKAGSYRFEARVTCGTQVSEPAVVEAVVREVPPRPAAGRVRVVRAGDWFLLDGAFSSDANGGALALQWDQVLGPAATRSTSGAYLPLRLRRPGLSAFSLSVTDPAGLSASADVPVLVVDGRQAAPTALPVSPVVAAVGDLVALDASSSLWPAPSPLTPVPGPWFQWLQLEGPAVTLEGSDTAAPRFLAAEAGRHAFEVSIVDGELRSPPARVEVFVAETAGGLPQAVASAPASARADTPVALDGSGSASRSGAPLRYEWRQLAGPAAGLTEEDAEIARVVPFDAGYYEFELTVVEGSARSLPAKVSFVADVAGRERLVAKASGPAQAAVDERVQLLGEALGVAAPVVRRRNIPVAARPARYLWTQVSGPWVPLDGAESPAPTFAPRAPGLYEFELVAESGGVRSAPSRLTVLVTAREN